MAIDFERLSRDRGIRLAPSGHKHTRPGWVQAECPFCVGNPGYHLGYQAANDRFNCWRCGAHRTGDTIAALLKLPLTDAFDLIRGYHLRGSQIVDERPRAGAKTLTLPPQSRDMASRHQTYLLGRGYDPDALSATWGLLGTGPIGDYKFRIVAPIIFGGIMVSYQCRDITGRASVPYLACAIENEVMHHKHCLYGMDKASGHSVAIVEGIADVWRLGPGAVATFGIGYTTEQVAMMRLWKRRFVLFDSADPQAMDKAERLANALSAFGGWTEIIEIDAPDPGEMEQEDADSLMAELGF